jgi:hypothetical protein
VPYRSIKTRLGGYRVYQDLTAGFVTFTVVSELPTIRQVSMGRLAFAAVRTESVAVTTRLGAVLSIHSQPPHCWAVASPLSIEFIHSILEYSNL